jgi:hypothetical protein
MSEVIKKSRSFTEFYEAAKAKEEARKGLRPSNQETEGKMERNEVNGLESWVCSNCGKMIVADVNGCRAKMKVGKNTKLFVRFAEMAAYCENCHQFNRIELGDELDNAMEMEQEGKQPPTFFFESRDRALQDMPADTKDELTFVADYLLKLK